MPVKGQPQRKIPTQTLPNEYAAGLAAPSVSRTASGTIASANPEKIEQSGSARQAEEVSLKDNVRDRAETKAEKLRVVTPDAG